MASVPRNVSDWLVTPAPLNTEKHGVNAEITLSLSDGDLIIMVGVVYVTTLTVYHWGRCGRSHYSTPLVNGQLCMEDW